MSGTQLVIMAVAMGLMYWIVLTFLFYAVKKRASSS